MTSRTTEAPEATRVDEIRELGLRRIVETQVAGSGTGHAREHNLLAIQKFVDGDPHCAWNFPNPRDYAFNDVLGMIASLTGCSSDPGHRVGDGYISPNRTLAGLEQGALRIADTARRGGTFLLATGHPGSMLSYYLGVAGIIEALGGRLITPARGLEVPPKCVLDYVGPVAVLTDRSNLLHTHDFSQMEDMLAEAGDVDMVVADHGYAGAAIEAGIPTIATMDTNDPALAVWKRAGADLTIIPIDDNEILSAYLPHVATMRAFAGLDGDVSV
jgi:hypothetical protein